MIIDCILDAVDFGDYDPKEFYDYLTEYYSKSDYSRAIATALIQELTRKFRMLSVSILMLTASMLILKKR